MIEDFQANGEDICVPELISLYANNVGETTDSVHEFCGVEYNMEGGLHDLAEYTHDRELADAGGGAGATESLHTAVAESGAEVLLSTTADKLTTDNGAVTGLVATAKDGTAYTIKADSVVLATGGYGNSDEWLTDELKDTSLYYGLASSTGDGLTMATADDVNAATRMLEYAKRYPNGVEVSAGRAKSTIDGNILVWPMSAILVNPEGERVVNEKASNHDILEAEVEQTDSMLYLLMIRKTTTCGAPSSRTLVSARRPSKDGSRRTAAPRRYSPTATPSKIWRKPSAWMLRRCSRRSTRTTQASMPAPTNSAAPASTCRTRSATARTTWWSRSPATPPPWAASSSTSRCRS